jgi:hypothetical protein
MHIVDMNKYGHQFFMKSLEGVEAGHLDDAGVCGTWSVKDVVAHIASNEGFLIEVLHGLLGIDAPTPFMKTMMELGPYGFNDAEVEKRHDKPYAEVLGEYEKLYAEAHELLAKIPLDVLRTDGVLEWYGAEYDFEDFFVYSFYAHKREHGGQINVFKDRLKIRAAGD